MGGGASSVGASPSSIDFDGAVLFQQFDTDGDGLLSVSEIEAAAAVHSDMVQATWPGSCIRATVEELDGDGDGSLTLSEFQCMLTKLTATAAAAAAARPGGAVEVTATAPAAGARAPPTAEAVTLLLEAQLVAELSEARTNPGGLAARIAARKAHFKGNDYYPPGHGGKLALPSKEGTRAVDEAVQFLHSLQQAQRRGRNQSAAAADTADTAAQQQKQRRQQQHLPQQQQLLLPGPLAQPSDPRALEALKLSAEDHLVDRGTLGRVGHRGVDGSRAADRQARYGRWSGKCGECLWFGRAWQQPQQLPPPQTDTTEGHATATAHTTTTTANTTARAPAHSEQSDARARAAAMVEDLVIDDGVASRGHRACIFDPAYCVAAARCGPHAAFGAMAVIEFAASFAAPAADDATAQAVVAARRATGAPKPVVPDGDGGGGGSGGGNGGDGVGGDDGDKTAWSSQLGKCAGCAHAIKGGAVVEVALLGSGNSRFHKACFACVACGIALFGVPYVVEVTTRAPHCKPCHVRLFAPTCAGCGEKIAAGGVAVGARGAAAKLRYHKECKPQSSSQQQQTQQTSGLSSSSSPSSPSSYSVMAAARKKTAGGSNARGGGGGGGGGGGSGSSGSSSGGSSSSSSSGSSSRQNPVALALQVGGGGGKAVAGSTGESIYGARKAMGKLRAEYAALGV
jgi:hypothetical protein